MYYPILFTPIYKQIVWGGDNLKNVFNRDVPFSHVGESWDISCREGEMGVAENGGFRGKTFEEIINSDRRDVLGTIAENEKVFPLLVKIIDATEDLSVQVHPNDAYAKKIEGDRYGKTEMWYILNAPENAALIVGLKDGVTKKDLSEALKNGDPMGLFNRVSVKKGDIIDIPAGLIHAITAGITLAEVQQSSDRTYRVYDYNRKGLDGNPRELHVEKALDVADFLGILPKKPVTRVENQYFTAEAVEFPQNTNCATNGKTFELFTAIDEAGGEISGVTVPYGRTAFLPAALGDYEITGRFLKSYLTEKSS